MDKEQVRLAARLTAIEMAVADLHKMVYLTIGATDEMLRAERARARQQMSQETFAGPDPAVSDLLAGEIQEARERLYTLIDDVWEASKHG